MNHQMQQREDWAVDNNWGQCRVCRQSSQMLFPDGRCTICWRWDLKSPGARAFAANSGLLESVSVRQSAGVGVCRPKPRSRRS